MDKTQAYLEIEETLKEDPSGRAKQTLIEELNLEAQQVRNALNQGVSSDEYEKLTLLLQSFETAVKVVEQIWIQLHQEPSASTA
ncbi:MAG: EscE/YscE/SsaE family type III secretion system needle protein co-chaperone [Candidatus Competibacterales bacterium]